MANVGRARIIRNAIVENSKSRRWWAKRPVNQFTRDGFEVVPGFLDPDECRRIVEVAEQHLPGPSHWVSDKSFTWVKSESVHGRNSCVRELLNIDDIDPGVSALLCSRRIQDLFSERLGEDVELLGFSVQYDGIDKSTKRGFHVDGLFPPQLKAFIYLNDVEIEGDGPYTVISGSHRSFFRKFLNDFWNAMTSGARRDMNLLFPMKKAQPILAPRGTLILSTQDMVHKGWSDHWHNPRHVMIGYGRMKWDFTGDSIREGIEAVSTPRG